MTVREGWRVEHLRQELLAAGIAMQHRVFAAFFKVQDELHGHAGLARPLGMWEVVAVAAQITRVAALGEGGVGHLDSTVGPQRGGQVDGVRVKAQVLLDG